MIPKNLTLNIYCKDCQYHVWRKYILIVTKAIEYVPLLNTKLQFLYPENMKCSNCNSKNLENSYSYVHRHVFTKDEIDTDVTRCRKQLDALEASDMTPEDKKILRGSFNRQLNNMLTQNNVRLL